MPAFIRNPREFWSGIIFLFFGLAAVWIGQDYTMGTAGRMGPGYFPTVLGGLLAAIGLVAVVRSFFSHGEPVGKLAVREAAYIIAATLLFGFLVRNAGLAIATIVLVLLSAIASRKFKVLPGVLLAIGLTVFSVLVFVKGLGLPIPVFGSWLNF